METDSGEQCVKVVTTHISLGFSASKETTVHSSNFQITLSGLGSHKRGIRGLKTIAEI